MIKSPEEAGGTRAGLTCRVSRMDPRMSITSPCITHLGSLFRNFLAVILEPARNALEALAWGVTVSNGGGHLELILHSSPTT